MSQFCKKVEIVQIVYRNLNVLKTVALLENTTCKKTLGA